MVSAYETAAWIPHDFLNKGTHAEYPIGLCHKARPHLRQMIETSGSKSCSRLSRIDAVQEILKRNATVWSSDEKEVAPQG